MNSLEFTEKVMDQIADSMFEIHREIWGLAEASNQEYESARILCQALRKEGFWVEEGVCGTPTAFIASYGTGHPCVGFLGEYDALPGLSQEAGVPVKKPICENGYGHGCGHSALGVGSLAAAIIAKRYLETTKKQGKVIYYGCCAEEDEGVKPLMARDGKFDGTDCVFAWHPGSENGVRNMEFVAIKCFDVKFSGVTAHAGGAPHLGRSALDACELMNVGVNYLREHVIPEARLQYAYVDAGGTAPNVVQDHGALTYGVRAPRSAQVDEIVKRVLDCAEGAALMTGTTFQVVPKMGYSDVFQNHIVAGILSDAAAEVGAPKWSEEDYELAGKFVSQYNEIQMKNLQQLVKLKKPESSFEEILKKPLDTGMESFDGTKKTQIYGGSDVGDVGYVTPTASLSVATSALGTPGHSWFMTGMTGSSIGEKGIACAGKIMGLAAVKVYDRPELLDGAQEERIARTGGVYHCPMEFSENKK